MLLCFVLVLSCYLRVFVNYCICLVFVGLIMLFETCVGLVLVCLCVLCSSVVCLFMFVYLYELAGYDIDFCWVAFLRCFFCLFYLRCICLLIAVGCLLVRLVYSVSLFQFCLALSVLLLLRGLFNYCLMFVWGCLC